MRNLIVDLNIKNELEYKTCKMGVKFFHEENYYYLRCVCRKTFIDFKKINFFIEIEVNF